MVITDVLHVAVSFRLLGGVGELMLRNSLNDFLCSSTYPGFLLVCSKFYNVCYYV